MRKQNMPNTSVTQTWFSEKGRVKELVSEKLALFNGDIADLIPWETHKNAVFGFNGWGNLSNRPNPIQYMTQKIPLI